MAKATQKDKPKTHDGKHRTDESESVKTWCKTTRSNVHKYGKCNLVSVNQ